MMDLRGLVRALIVVGLGAIAGWGIYHLGAGWRSAETDEFSAEDEIHSAARVAREPKATIVESSDDWYPTQETRNVDDPMPPETAGPWLPPSPDVAPADAAGLRR